MALEALDDAVTAADGGGGVGSAAVPAAVDDS